MEPQQRLDDYFDVVDDFFEKTFREDEVVRIALKTIQAADRIEGEKKSESSVAASDIKISPSVVVQRQGDERSTYGQLRVGSTVRFGPSYSLYQRCKIDTNGQVMAKVDVGQLVAGLDLRARFATSTLVPGEDLLEIEGDYEVGDFYAKIACARAASHDQGITVDLGTRVRNATVGIGLSRDVEGRDVDAMMYVGGGFSGNNWEVAGRLERENNVWSSVEVCARQVLGQSLRCMAKIEIDMPNERSLMEMGFEQSVAIPEAVPVLPQILGKALTVGAKLSSLGSLVSRVGFTYGSWLNCTGIASWSLLEAHTLPQYGLQLSITNE